MSRLLQVLQEFMEIGINILIDEIFDEIFETFEWISKRIIINLTEFFDDRLF